MYFQNQHKIVTDGGSAITVEQQPRETTVQTVIRGIATAKGTPECDLDPLYNSIEPEALNGLMRHSQRATADVAIAFTHEGFAVQVEDGGLIKIRDSPPDENEELM